MILLVSDLDGTLLDSNGAVPFDELRQLLRVLKGKRATFAVATSRSSHNVATLFGKGLPRPAVVISHDGAAVVALQDQRMDVIAEWLLPAVSAELMARQAAGMGEIDLGLFLGACRDFAVLLAPGSQSDVSGRSRQTQTMMELIDDGRPVRISTREDLVDQASSQPVRAVTCFGDREAIQSADDRLGEVDPGNTRLLSYPETRRPGDWWWLDVHRQGLSKATAIAALMKRARYSRLIALGNGDNDVEMFDLADWSACPSGSTPRARAAATTPLPARPGGDFLSSVTTYLPKVI